MKLVHYPEPTSNCNASGARPARLHQVCPSPSSRHAFFPTASEGRSSGEGGEEEGGYFFSMSSRPTSDSPRPKPQPKPQLRRPARSAAAWQRRNDKSHACTAITDGWNGRRTEGRSAVRGAGGGGQVPVRHAARRPVYAAKGAFIGLCSRVGLERLITRNFMISGCSSDWGK